ncbi:MAG TPA: hypothetical protein VF006_28440 [Longimicrobium sp.]
MPSSAPAAHPAGSPATTPHDRSLRLSELERVAATYGFEPVLNESPHEAEPEPAEAVLRRHLPYLRLAGSVLDPFHRPRPRLSEIPALDGVPMRVEAMERYAPLQHCILCTQTKGETYTICAGCYTTQMRFIERMLLEIRPDIDEATLRKHQALDHADYVRAIRRTPRLEPKRRGRLEPGVEAVRRAARRALEAAERAARLDTLRGAAEEDGLAPAERRRRIKHVRAAEAAAKVAAHLDALRVLAQEPGLSDGERRERIADLRAAESEQVWNPSAWRRGLAANPLEDAWLALLLAAGEADEEEREPDDDYPVEWLAADWLQAPDRVDFLEETAPPLVPHPNTAAGGPEHLAALERNALLDAYRAARARAAYEEGPSPYVDWLAAELDARGGIPARLRARAPQEWDAEECERWDRWVDCLLGGEPAAAPEALDPFDAAACAHWGAALTIGEDGERTPVHLSRLDRGLPSGRMRWPRFIREEIEAEFQPWGRWVEIDDEDVGAFRAWTDDDTPPRRRRLTRAATDEILRRRLEAWAKHGAGARRHGRRRSLEAVRPRGSRGAWEREIRAERRRRRFEQMARANAGVHATHLEHARSQSI